MKGRSVTQTAAASFVWRFLRRITLPKPSQCNTNIQKFDASFRYNIYIVNIDSKCFILRPCKYHMQTNSRCPLLIPVRWMRKEIFGYPTSTKLEASRINEYTWLIGRDTLILQIINMVFILSSEFVTMIRKFCVFVRRMCLCMLPFIGLLDEMTKPCEAQLHHMFSIPVT